MSHRRLGATAALALLALPLLLTGCTAAPTPTASPHAGANLTGLPQGVEQATSVPTDVPNDPKLRSRVALTSCDQAHAGWQAGGTAANPGDTARDYTITVFFTTDKGTVLGTTNTKVTVKAHGTQAWAAKATLTPTPKTLCVLRGVG